MNLLNKSLVILISGGLDSSTVLGIAKNKGALIYGLSFDYGQRHKKELIAAKKIASHFSIQELKIIKLDLTLWGGSSLTDTREEIPRDGIQLNKIPKFVIDLLKLKFL